MKSVYEFVGGPLNGAIMDKLDAEPFSDGCSEDLSAIRKAGGCVRREELDNQPTFTGYLGPMWDGIRTLGNDVKWHYDFDEYTAATPIQQHVVLRYESQQVYDMLSN